MGSASPLNDTRQPDAELDLPQRHSLANNITGSAKAGKANRQPENPRAVRFDQAAPPAPLPAPGANCLSNSNIDITS